ncbi:MAG TPA: hypothetical protein PLH31_16780 [Caulobacter sp.]|nr:hypothetical protein [Caulobacter sp.]
MAYQQIDATVEPLDALLGCPGPIAQICRFLAFQGMIHLGFVSFERQIRRCVHGRDSSRRPATGSSYHWLQ